MIKKFLHPSVVGQAVSLLASIALVALLSRFLPTSDYAIYLMSTALWAVGNAVIGTAIGTRVARESANGSIRIRVGVTEIASALIASLAVVVYTTIVTSNLFVSLLSGAVLLSFVAAEARLSFEIGRKSFRYYLGLLLTRVTLPVLLLIILGLSSGFTLENALFAAAIGNLAVAFIRPSLWRIFGIESRSVFGRSVGFLNLGLWIIASVDRVLLERLTEAVYLATYALVYGLLDKGFRALSNAFITRYMGDTFQSGRIRISGFFYVTSALLTIFAVPCGVYGARIISNGRYVPDWTLTSIISLAMMFMLWSTPGYLLILQRGKFVLSICVIFSIAIVNICLNVLWIPIYGIIASALISLVSYGLWFVWTRIAIHYRL